MEDLRERLETTEKTHQQKDEEEEEQGVFSSPLEAMSERRGGGEGSTLPSQDFSRMLSETLQALEESICTVSTPGRCSFESCIDNLPFHDLEAARVRVMKLVC